MGDLPTVETNQDPNSYFLSEPNESKVGIFEKLRPFFTSMRYYAVQAWPYITRIMSATVYFLITLLKGTVKMMIDQVKNFKGE